MNRLIIILTLGLLISCNSKIDTQEKSETIIVHDTIKITERVIDTIYVEKPDFNGLSNSDFYIQERLPNWFLELDILKGKKFKKDYEIDNRLNPLYLEADFNGDDIIDIAIPIKQSKSQKVGFAIIHGQTNEVFIIGAGTPVKNGLSDDMSYIDIWKVNRLKSNEPGLDENGDIDKNGPLILENPSMQLEKSEVGGGQIYWNGKGYVYFHQTC